MRPSKYFSDEDWGYRILAPHIYYLWYVPYKRLALARFNDPTFFFLSLSSGNRTRTNATGIDTNK
jgi:hypothetical protein